MDRGPSPYISNLEVFCDGLLITVVQGDGVIVATPTGSTACVFYILFLYSARALSLSLAVCVCAPPSPLSVSCRFVSLKRRSAPLYFMPSPSLPKLSTMPHTLSPWPCQSRAYTTQVFRLSRWFYGPSRGAVFPDDAHLPALALFPAHYRPIDCNPPDSRATQQSQ